MKHLSSIVLAVAVVAAGATACFKDPTSSLRKGPNRIELTRSAVVLSTGDSLAVQAELKDEQGNTYDAGNVQWATDNAAVATVRVDSTPIPYNAFSRGFVLAASPTGGVAHVTVTSGSISSGFRVLNLPKRFSASMPPVFRGPTTVVDTIISKRPDNTIALDVFTTGDTVVFKNVAGSDLTLDPTASTVSFGAMKAYVLARSADSIKVVAPNSFHGRPWITKLTWHGPAEVGNVAIDSLQGDSIAVAKPRYRGSIVVSSGIVMTISAPPTGLTFRTSTSPAASRTEVFIHGKRASIIQRTASLLVVSDTALADSAGYTGGVIISNVDYSAGIRFDSLWSTGAFTISRVSFPGTISTPATLMDTIKVRAPGLLNAATSNVTVGGLNAWILYRSADSIYALAKQPGAISVTNVTTGGVTFPSLAPARAINVPATPTGAPNEPGNNSRATATAVSLTGTTTASPLLVYGVMDATNASDYWDYYTFTTTAVDTVTATLSWFGNGTGGASYTDTNNPDFDVIICGPAPVTSCGYGADLSGNAGSGLSQPETFTVILVVPGQYYIRTFAYVTAGPVVYQLALHKP